MICCLETHAKLQTYESFLTFALMIDIQHDCLHGKHVLSVAKISKKTNAGDVAPSATSKVLMFLEPHVVVTPGWLEPLLARLEKEPKALVMPSLDVLDQARLD